VLHSLIPIDDAPAVELDAWPDGPHHRYYHPASSGCEVRLGDLRGMSGLGKFDLVATNPPFKALGKGVLPTDHECSIAHHEVA
jgi:hypothetical protein